MPIVFDEVRATIEDSGGARSAAEASGQSGTAEGKQGPSEPPADIAEQLRLAEVRAFRLKAD